MTASRRPAAAEIPFSPQDAMAFMQKLWNPFGLPMPGLHAAAPTTRRPAAAPCRDAVSQSRRRCSPRSIPAEVERKINELKIIEGWLAMSLNMMQMSIKTMELQKASLEAMRATHAPASTPGPRPAKADMAITLYYGSGSPYAWRVQLALEHKALPYERKMLSFADKDTRKPEFLALNPRHRVPTITDGDFTLYESNAIVEYLDDAYPAQGRPLFPGDAKQSRAGAAADLRDGQLLRRRRSTRSIDLRVLHEARRARRRQARRGEAGRAGRVRDVRARRCAATFSRAICPPPISRSIRWSRS